MSIEALKEQARRHEQKEQWDKALDLYEQAISRLSGDETPDISLYNRAGDLATRLGRVEQAVRHYERAVDLYVEAELPNNAIAVCKKVLRNVPDRHQVFLRMGQIRAAQGFLPDARANFLEYAGRMQAAGEIDEAFRALIEFADLAPDDHEIRLSLAAQLQQHERVDEAVQQLIQAHQVLTRRGLIDQAAEVEEQIRALDPGAVIPAPGEAAPAVGVTGTAAGGGFEGLEHTSLGVSEGDEGTGEALPALDFGDDGTEGVELEPAAAAVDEGEVDTVDLGLSDFDISFGGPEAGEDEGEDEGEGEAEPLPTFGFDDEGEGEGEGEAEPLPTFGFDDDEGEGEGEGEGEPEPLPTFGFDDEGEGEGGGEGEGEPEPLPTFGFGDEGEGEGEPESGEAPAAVEAADTPVDAPETAADEPADAVEAAHEEGAADRAETAAEPAAGAPDEAAPDGASLLDEGRAALERGDVDEGVETLRRAHVALAESGDVNGAIEALSALLEHRPDDREGHQRLVEYAFRSGDNTVLGRAYLGLARCLEAGGDATRARAVYEQVLQVDPENADAQAALGRAAASEEKKVAEVASSEDYVDLGSLILDEPEEKSTRFVVAYEEPTGDEQADFAKMLSQFKEKVAENVDADDVMAHHDLGTAYKEMGLLDEAIAEFQQALRASPDHLPTYELLGQTFLEKGQPEAAIRSLTRALDAPYEVEDELIGIYYHLGRAHEAIEHRDEALDFYERVFSLDINFADVTDRLRTLRGED